VCFFELRALLVLALSLWAAPASASDPTIGGSCSSVGQSGDSERYDGTGDTWCNGTTWQYPAYQFGSTSNSCSSTTAGQVQYTGGVLEACVATGSTYTWIPISSGITLISTQTASGSASLQFSGSNWSSSYNTLLLNCSGLMISGGGGVYVGEGTGGSFAWETASDYAIAEGYVYTSGAGPTYAGWNASNLMGIQGSASVPQSFEMHIYNVGSSSIYKIVTFLYGGYLDSGSNTGLFYQTGASYWDNDKNPITGLEIVPSSGTIASGACSLYGMN
jgi:hypothetical protein